MRLDGTDISTIRTLSVIKDQGMNNWKWELVWVKFKK